MFSRWENQAFNVSTMFASGENVAVFGDFQVELAGQGGELPVLDPRVVDGKVTCSSSRTATPPPEASARDWGPSDRGRRRAVCVGASQ